MFGFLKKLLRKLVETPAETQQPPAHEFASETEGTAPAAESIPEGLLMSEHRAQRGGRGIELSLQLILQALPLELQPRVQQTDVGTATISVPLEKVLAQLSRGAVKISFGELR